MNRKKSQTFERKSNNLMRYQKVNKLKQLGFTTSWNINDHKKPYDALEDPHADRYFRYQSVKMHIKQLKRSLGKQQKNGAEKKKLAKLIKQKLSDHLPAIKVAAQTYNIKRQQLDSSKVSQHLTKQKSLTEIGKKLNKSKSKHKKKLNTEKVSARLSVQPISQKQGNQRSFSHSGNIEDVLTGSKVQTQQQGQRSQKSMVLIDRKQEEKKEYLKKQQQLLHKKKHQEFISFLAKKKQTLQALGKE